MRAASGWNSIDDYVRFLTLQHAARAPVEEWLADNASQSLNPPAQCPHIARDLEVLGHSAPPTSHSFALPGSKHPESQSLGVAWVLAGSSLGNRSILKEVRRAGNGSWPHAFLGDEAMLEFWQGLRREIERPAEADEVEAASMAANAVFDHFLRCAQMAPAQ